jgi:uncharacterized integral membrane protein
MSGRAPGRSGRAPIGLIASGIAGVLLLVFVLQNTEQAKVKFLWMNVTWGIWRRHND